LTPTQDRGWSRILPYVVVGVENKSSDDEMLMMMMMMMVVVVAGR
jgi:hypothetical protein